MEVKEMKSICILIILAFAFNYSASTQILQNSGITNTLRSVCFINENIGWSVGDSGVIIKTTNSGTDWELKHSDSSYQLNSVFFLDNKIGWAGGYEVTNQSILLKTINGGETWQRIDYNETYGIDHIRFFNDSIGWLIENREGYGGRFRQTINGGLTWNTKYSFNNNVATPFYFMNPDTGWITSWRFIKKTFNGGESWISIGNGLPIELGDCHFACSFFLNENLGWVINLYGGNTLYTTENGGESWSSFNPFSSPISNFYNVKFLDKNIGVVVASYIDFNDDMKLKSDVLITNNSGKTWNSIYRSNSLLTGLFLLDNYNCWAVGENGKILKFSLDTTTVGVENRVKDNIVPEKIGLFQNYPNPFNPLTTIKYNLRKPSAVILTIYNISGQELETLVNDFQTTGEHKITWQPKGLPSGIYFYRIQAGEFSETKKLFLQK